MKKMPYTPRPKTKKRYHATEALAYTRKHQPI